MMYFIFFFFSSRRRHTRCGRDWSSDVCSSDLRRPLLNVVSAVCTLVPVLLAQAAGFGWTDGLAAARQDLMVRLGPARSAVLWGMLGLAALLIACGPAVVASARKVRMTPGW